MRLERWLAGVDEAGRGPLAGPVVAAAVVLDPGAPIEGLADSKALDAPTRERLALEIRARSLAFGIGLASAEEIDAHNILQATFIAMRRALAQLPALPLEIEFDGNRCPTLDGLGPAELVGAIRSTAIVRGDATRAAISAASILAKTHRDSLMKQADAMYPEYGFAGHKGYPTRAHLDALDRFGACPIHRRSYAPVRSRLRGD